MIVSSEVGVTRKEKRGSETRQVVQKKESPHAVRDTSIQAINAPVIAYDAF